MVYFAILLSTKALLGAHEVCFRVCIFLLCICLDGIFDQSVVYVGSAAVRMKYVLECVYSYNVYV